MGNRLINLYNFPYIIDIPCKKSLCYIADDTEHDVIMVYIIQQVLRIFESHVTVY